MAAETKKIFKDALTGKDLKWADEDQLERAVQVAKEAAQQVSKEIPGIKEALRAIREELTKRVASARAMVSAVGATDSNEALSTNDKKLSNEEKAVIKNIVGILPIKKPEKKLLTTVLFNVEKSRGISYLKTEELMYVRVVMILLLTKQARLVEKAIAKMSKVSSLDELSGDKIRTEFNDLLKKGVRFCNYSLKKQGVDLRKLRRLPVKSTPAPKVKAAIAEDERLEHAEMREGGAGPDELKVVLVDGEKIRKDVDVDFTMGGNPSRYAYVPKGELWVEKSLSLRDMVSTIVHESIEHRLMKNKGMSYGDAHEKANQIDETLRDAIDQAMAEGE